MSRSASGLLALALLVAGGRTVWAADDQPLSGRRLLLTGRPNRPPTLAIRSTDAAVGIGAGAGTVDDPTVFGGSLRVHSEVAGGFDAFYQLPAMRWHVLGRPEDHKGYRFRNPSGPIARVVVQPGRQIVVMGRGALAQTLAANPMTVTVVLQAGARRFCMQFGGTATFVADARFRAVGAPAPASCPALVDWPTYGFDLARSRFNPREGLINRSTVRNLAVRWFFPIAGTGAVSASPTVVGGVVYVGSWDGKMYALDAFSGLPRWTFDIADPHPEARGGIPGIQSSAAVANGVVYFGAADANVYALDAASGTLVWRTSLGDPDPAVEGAHVWSSPAVFDGKVYVGKSSHLDNPCVRGAVVALDATTGQEAWRFEALPARICGSDTRRPCTTDADCAGGSACGAFLVCRSGNGEQAQSRLCTSDADCTAPATCQRPLGGGVTSSAALDPAKGAVYASIGDCVGSGATGFAESIVALDAQTGAVRWSFEPLPPGDLADLDFVASPNVFSATVGTTPRNLVGAGSKDGTYYAVDQDTGAPVWQRTIVPGGFLGGFNASTGVANGDVYGGTFTGPPFEFALSASDGSTAWQCPGSECGSFSFGPPAIAPGVVFLGDGTGKLRAFDADSGTLLAAIDLGGGISSGPAVVNGMVIVGAGTGSFGSGQRQGIYGLALP